MSRKLMIQEIVFLLSCSCFIHPMNKLLFTLTLLLMSTLAALAQFDCNNYLDQAQKLYDIGNFNEAAATIKNCSTAEKDPVKLWQSSRLLAKSFIGLGDMTAAKIATEDMLERNPLYKTSLIEDSREFVNLINKVNVVPRFSLSLSTAAGINVSYPQVINSYGITNDKKTYSNGKAKQFGLFAGYSFSDKVSMQTGVLYAENNYALKYSVQNLNFKYEETLTYLQVPLFIRYQLKPKGNFKVFVQAGLITGFLTKAKYDIEKTSTSLESTNLKSIEVTNNRTKTIFGTLFGAGASYKLREGHVFGEINYQYSFTNINKPNTRLDNENLVYNYFFIDDDLQLNNLTFSLGYTFYLNYFVQRSK